MFKKIKDWLKNLLSRIYELLPKGFIAPVIEESSNKNTKSYAYLVDIKNLEVRRYNLFNKIDFKSYIKDYKSGKWFRTDKSIYLRYKKGIMTHKSFVPSEYPSGSGNFIVANVVYNLKI
jgi:hypothetical protein